jgi:hypothetical protein
MTEQGLTCLGYYVVRLFEPPATLSGDLLPEKVLTVSPCLNESFPNSWALDWVKCTDEERAASASRLGIPSTDLPRVSARVGELFNSGALAWPNVWRQLEVARSVTRELLEESGDLALVGVGVPREFVAPLLSELAPQSQEGAPGVYLAALADERMSAGGSLAGWEVLGFERGACHSWLCNGIHVDAASRVERFLGALGLLESEAAAREILRIMAEDPEKAEPATWVPAAVVQYDL